MNPTPHNETLKLYVPLPSRALTYARRDGRDAKPDSITWAAVEAVYETLMERKPCTVTTKKGIATSFEVLDARTGRAADSKTLKGDLRIRCEGQWLLAGTKGEIAVLIGSNPDCLLVWYDMSSRQHSTRIGNLRVVSDPAARDYGRLWADDATKEHLDFGSDSVDMPRYNLDARLLYPLLPHINPWEYDTTRDENIGTVLL